MNNKRRKRLKEVIKTLKTCSSTLDSIKDEEDTARDGIPENLEDGDIYRNSEECSDKIEDAISDIDGVVEDLENIT